MLRNLTRFERTFTDNSIKFAVRWQVSGPLTEEIVAKTIKRIYLHQPTLQRKPIIDTENDKVYFVECPFEESFSLQVFELSEENPEFWADKTVEILDSVRNDKSDKLTRVLFFKNPNSENGPHEMSCVFDHLMFDGRSSFNIVSDFMRFVVPKNKKKNQNEEEEEEEIVPLEPKDFNFTEHSKCTKRQLGETKFNGFDFKKLTQILGPKPDHQPSLKVPPKFEGQNKFGYIEGSKHERLHFVLDEETTSKLLKKCKQYSVKPFTFLTDVMFASMNSFWNENKESKILPGIFVDTRSHYEQPLENWYIAASSWPSELEERVINGETLFWELAKAMQKEIDFQINEGCILQNILYMAASKVRNFGIPTSSAVNNYGCYEKLNHPTENGAFTLNDIHIMGLSYPPLPTIQLSTYSVKGKIKLVPLFSRQVYKQETVIKWMTESYLVMLNKIIDSNNDLSFSQLN
ncbi:alcohol o-acetyltransferase 1-related [Anaeramoeba flamelloides]|uniref:Alcohol o-acetyltransferase 1-related n=1 Tax=Anaeramoeba flamelloides TaxID=1746091 RepID=A0ABQ8X5C0_9EUKA|nr:alcohol o-acetyltransferase 1-related [Anaeramoeba flamelloides]